MSIIAHILQGLCELSPCQRRFFEHLLGLWPCLNGRFTLLNLSRYSAHCERTFRRHLSRPFPWGRFNASLLEATGLEKNEVMLAQDASFVPKSGIATVGVGRFYNGCSQRVERGLELSLLAVVDLARNTAYALHAQQTLACVGDSCKDLTHLRATQAHWPQGVRHLAVDGAYARRPFVEGACELGLSVVSRLRVDANVRTLYTGVQSGRGRPKLYDGKVVWKQLNRQRWQDEGELERGLHLYSATLNHVSLKRDVRVALLITTTRKGKERRVLLFSTDLTLAGREIVRLYRARFQIEFLFREAKSGAGLTHCQSRNAQTLHNHWNAAFAVVNLAKLTTRQTDSAPFSFSSCVQKQRNRHFLKLVSCTLGWDWNTIKAHPRFQTLQNYAVIAP